MTQPLNPPINIYLQPGETIGHALMRVALIARGGANRHQSKSLQGSTSMVVTTKATPEPTSLSAAQLVYHSGGPGALRSMGRIFSSGVPPYIQGLGTTTLDFALVVC